jgi:hypothetical protein
MITIFWKRCPDRLALRCEYAISHWLITIASLPITDNTRQGQPNVSTVFRRDLAGDVPHDIAAAE